MTNPNFPTLEKSGTHGLLKLHTIARNEQKVPGELDPHDHAGVLNFTRQQDKHLLV